MPRDEILIITRNFPPLVGGMERLMEHAVRQLSHNYSCSLIGPRGCEDFVTPVTVARGCQIAPLPFFMLHALLRALAAGSGGKHRFSLAGSGLTAPIAGMVKLYHHIPAISFVHGLDLIAENLVYQSLFVPWLRRMDIVIANSHNTARLAESKGVAPERIRIIHPGVTLPHQNHEKDKAFLSKYGLVGKKVLLSVGRLVPRKGLTEFLQLSFPAIISACPETILVIIGTEPENSLKRTEDTGSRIDKLVATHGLGNHLRFLGPVDDETLSQAYHAADLFIFPVRDIPGDVEGFGMVAIEAAAHGLPTLAFAAGGVPDAVSDNKTGFLVKSGDYRNMADTAIRYLTGEIPRISRNDCRDFASRFEWQRFGKQLLEICTSLETS